MNNQWLWPTWQGFLVFCGELALVVLMLVLVVRFVRRRRTDALLRRGFREASKRGWISEDTQ
jgi:membrane protein implicated in regulation of membrane protease activity